jgi:hypothetical protein
VSYSQIVVNEDDSIEHIVRQVNSLPSGWGFYLTPSLNKERTGIWKPSEDEKLDLLMQVVHYINRGDEVTGSSAASADIKEHIKGVVKFQYYRDNQLFYKTETGLTFPVPIADIGNATFLAEDKAILFMRYIRKFIATIPDKKDETF